MPGAGAHFSSEELARVLSHYDIGVIHKVKPLSAGSSHAPKMVIISRQGKFLLKRRPKQKGDLHRIAFAHAVQTHLAKKRFPVASLICLKGQARAGKKTILQLDNHIYEFFKFVTGSRYDGSAPATLDTGRQLASFHRYLAGFARQSGVRSNVPSGSFHDSATVRRHLKTIAADSNRKLKATAEILMNLYNASSVHVNELGFDLWPAQVVHGDWHPGNMLFYKRKLAAVLDFDSVKLAPVVTDLANGMLQFSIVGNRPNPADWPTYLDQAKLVHFLKGYRKVNKLDRHKLGSLLDLMIETMIAEAVLPVAATGFFGSFVGADFLKMIRRKAEWLNKNQKKLADAIED
jgi:Ser/Thr protein kinase RdoA (MazF antagonist)